MASNFGLGMKLLKRMCEEQKTIQWYKAKLITEMFMPGEQPVLSFVTNHLQSFHALPQAQTLFEKFPDIEQYPTPEPAAYYLTHLENRLFYDKINTANIASQQVLKDDPTNYMGAKAILSELIGFVAHQQYRMRVVDLAKEGPSMALNAYHDVMVTEPSGIFGWKHLDSTTGGLMPGDVVSIVGRPATGKSWLVFRQALVNWKMGRKPLVISMEMAPLPVVQRLSAMFAGTNIKQLKVGGYSTQTYKKFSESLLTMATSMSGFYVVDGNLAASVDDIYLLAEQLGCDQVYIDGAYLLKHSNKRLDRYTRVAENIELIKQRTSDVEMPTTASYQLARPPKSKNKTKIDTEDVGLEDIAYSDAIGQVSSIVLGLFQEESVETLEGRKVRILKGRNGEVGGFSINWNFQSMNFDQVVVDLAAPEHHQPLEYV